jgi:hypothetical protein
MVIAARPSLDVYVAQRNHTLVDLRARIAEFEAIGVSGILASAAIQAGWYTDWPGPRGPVKTVPKQEAGTSGTDP